MGFYIEVPERWGKALQLQEMYNAELLDSQPAAFSDIPEDKYLICVVRNPRFEAAAVVKIEYDFQRFLEPTDPRPKQWLLMDRSKVEELLPGLKR